MPALAPQAVLRRFAAVPFIAVTALVAVPRLAVSPPQARAQTSEGLVRLSPAMSTVPAGGGPFTVYVILENLSHYGRITYDDDRDTTPDREVQSDGLAAFQFTIDYDPSVVEIQSIEPGPALGSSGRQFTCLPLDREPGAVTFGCLSPGSSPAGAQGTMTLGVVQVVPRSSGLSPLVLSAEVAGPLGDSAEVESSGGAARVNGSVPQATATGQPGGSTTEPPGTTPGPDNTAIPTRPVASGTTPSQTATTTAAPTARSTLAPTNTPDNTTGPGNKPPTSDGSGRGAWVWIIAAAAGAVALSGGGLLAVMWQRSRPQGIL